ncbi:MAG TPA: hypothetical protein VHU84_13920, partial [Lacipirellulaceae bacterium]|nr:hypothetical protein [Lacipirellulaceae bacterium]
MRNHIASVRALDVQYSYEQHDFETGEEVVLSGEHRYAYSGDNQFQTDVDRWSNEQLDSGHVQRWWNGKACEVF